MRFLCITTAVASLLLSGCINGFEKYYQGENNARSWPAYDASFRSNDGDIIVYTSNDVPGDVQKLIGLGFAPIGESAFYMPDNKVSLDQLKEQARRLGAHAVLFHSAYRDTVTGAVPISVPNTSTSFTNANATAYGTGGVVNAYGTATTTTYGSTTTMVPFSTSRSNFDAVYFAKVHVRTGLYVVALTDSERQSLQTNLAVKVRAVVQDSPAFLANILPGDYLLTCNNEAVTSQDGWGALLKKYEGQDVNLALIRQGEALTKVVHVNSFQASNAVPSQ